MNADLGEQRVDQHVVDLGLGELEVFRLRELAQFFGQPVHLRFEQVGRPAGNRFLAVEHPCLQLGVDRRGGGAVFAAQYAGGFLADRLVAFAREHVDYRLRADDLRGRRHQRHVPEILAYRRDFLQHLVEPIARVLVAQLVFEVGQHAARDLRGENARIHALERALELRVLLAHVAEVERDFLEQRQVHAGIALALLHDRDEGFGR